MNNVETEFEKDAYGNLYGAHEPVTIDPILQTIDPVDDD